MPSDPSWRPVNRVQAHFEREGEQAQPQEKPTRCDATRERGEGCHLPYCNCGYGARSHCTCRSEAMAIALYGASFAVVLALLSLLL
ncbi:hypothetical protein KOR34_37230 [Posidoniimonas corsicana]|uniref:Uncharacterized protein n=1 Tax=Posidoniimonas corsicana TaxID=1938618 RepID=A0A5C5V7T2_9BACT|nr:hypothetical protein [Posidoniimonas corsicana]TWT33887.1 hypothetical protein KOR34_37230 [Posidoniimonas corsicana]